MVMVVVAQSENVRMHSTSAFDRSSFQCEWQTLRQRVIVPTGQLDWCLVPHVFEWE